MGATQDRANLVTALLVSLAVLLGFAGYRSGSANLLAAGTSVAAVAFASALIALGFAFRHREDVDDWIEDAVELTGATDPELQPILPPALYNAQGVELSFDATRGVWVRATDGYDPDATGVYDLGAAIRAVIPEPITSAERIATLPEYTGRHRLQED